ncbi:MAG: peptide chain release factor N(5)-glutamine methyltransferase [Desulfobacteraceae bacterium]|nr:peptide chain release factor N(5)-glutamine methyltransferase [Desulfobacteraceae bacterium]
MPQSADRTNGPWDVLSVVNWTAGHLHSSGIDSPRTTAELLVADALGMRRIDLYLHHDKPLQVRERDRIRNRIRRRLTREPTAYITGSRGFWTLDIAVSPNVLIPRPETELLVESALERLPSGGGIRRVLELGTGSGAVVAALVSERPAHRYLATDLSPDALRIARKNVATAAAEPSVRFLCGDWFSPLSRRRARFDLVVSNPPYVSRKVLQTLQPEIVRFEPRLALDGGTDGLACLRCILCDAHRYLSLKGWLLLEIGFDQKEAVERIAGRVGAYGPAEVRRDYGGCDRVVCLQRVR